MDTSRRCPWTETISLVQIPTRLDPLGRGWLRQSPGKPWQFTGLLGQPLLEDPQAFKILQGPTAISSEADAIRIMSVTLEHYALHRTNQTLNGPLLRAAVEAIKKLPYENSLWVLKATDGELDSWALTLATKHGAESAPSGE